MKKILAIAAILAALSPLAALPASAITADECINEVIILKSTDNTCKQLLQDAPLEPDRCQRAATATSQCTAVLSAAECGAKGLYNARCLAQAGTAGELSCSDHGPTNNPLCCVKAIESPKIPNIGDGVCKNEKEACADKADVVFYSCCICRKGDVLDKVSNERDTYDSCVKKCKDKGLDIYKAFGAGTLEATKSAATPSAANLAAVNALCFTKAECAGKDYGGSPSAFRAGMGCPSGKGRCVAPEPTVTLNVPIGGATTVKGIRGYIASAFQYALTVVAVFAAVMFTYGGFRYITGSAFGDFTKAKEIMIDSAVGLLLVLGAVTILNTVNPATTTLKMPDIYLINRQTVMSNKYCTDLKKAAGEIKFADAGAAPDYKDPNTATFDKAADDTVCNQEYFAEGFGENRCFGRSCKALGTGYACADCTNSQGKIPECQQKNTGSVCIQAQWTGNITWGGTEKPLELVPFAVCGFAQGATKFDTVEANMFKMNADVDLSGATIKEKVMTAGVAPYRIKFSPDALNVAKAKCVSAGNTFSGVVLGLKYQGMGWLGLAMTTPVGAAIEAISPGTLSNGGFALLTAADCGSAGRFSGYADLDGGYLDAYWCGMKIAANANLNNSTKLWSEEDIANAINGTRSIPPCDINLVNANAPDAPTKAFYGVKCGKGSILETSKGQ